jgi:hypothetical protein
VQQLQGLTGYFKSLTYNNFRFLNLPLLTNRPLEAFHANRALCNQLQQNFKGIHASYNDAPNDPLLQTEQEEKQSFAKKLGLEKSAKTESFVDRMQAGKYGNIGSKGGAHEL